jgi:hypothetical protein
MNYINAILKFYYYKLITLLSFSPLIMFLNLPHVNFKELS